MDGLDAVTVSVAGWTKTGRVTWGAGFQTAVPVASTVPAWLAVMSQPPVLSSVTVTEPVPLLPASTPLVAPERVQAVVSDEAKVTGLPERPPVAETVNGASPY